MAKITPHTRSAGTDKNVLYGLLIKFTTPSLIAGRSFICPAAAYTTALSIVSTIGVTALEASNAEPIAIFKSTCNGILVRFLFIQSD